MMDELSNSGVPTSSVDVLVRLYRRAATELREIVLHPPGGTSRARAFARTRATDQLRQVEDVLRKLGVDVAGWVGDHVPKAYLNGVIGARKQLEALGVDGGEDSAIRGSFSLIDTRAMEVLAQDIYADLSKATNAMGDGAKRAVRKTAQQDLSEVQINTILARGILLGKPQQAIADLRKDLEAVAGKQLTIINKNGDPMTFDTGKYAEMIARTKTREVMERARHNRLESSGIELVRVIGAVSVNFCSAYLGAVFSLKGNHPKYPPLSSLPGGKGPPFHPNCSKSTRPFIEDLASETQLREADGVADLAKMTGINATTAQKRFKDLQVFQQLQATYAVGSKAYQNKKFDKLRDPVAAATAAPARAAKPVAKKPAAQPQPKPSQPVAPASITPPAQKSKTEQLRAQLAKATEARQEAERMAADAIRRRDEAARELASALARNAMGSEIAAIQTRIAIAERSAKDYERRIKRQERRN